MVGSIKILSRRGLFLSSFFFIATLGHFNSASAQGSDYDGNGFSEIPVLVSKGASFEWTLFDPITRSSTVFTKGFGDARNGIIIGNWIYPHRASAGILGVPTAQSGGRMSWTIRTNVVTQSPSGKKSTKQIEIRKYLGRKGDLVVTGADFTGDGITDACVLVERGGGVYTWGVRGGFFQASYIPGAKGSLAYFRYGRVGIDKPFFVNVDGKSDWFALLSRSGDNYTVTLQQPFSGEHRTVNVGSIPDGNIVPVPVQQDDGTDLLAFYGFSGDTTSVVVKDLQGNTISSFTIPYAGHVTVGNYGPGPGEEIAVSSRGRFTIINPITETQRVSSGPNGVAADSININNLG